MGKNETYAWVLRRRGITSFWRIARGFSIGELKEVGLTISQARRFGIPVDKRRKSKHPRNVEILRVQKM